MEFTNATEFNDAISSGFVDFQDSLDYTVPPSDHYMDDDTLGKLLEEVHGEYAAYRRAEGVSVSPSSMSVMFDRTGKLVEEMIAEERESSSAQIRTLLNEQRKTIIAEYCEKVSHNELIAAQAEHERRILQGELLRQQQNFREVHQQNLIKMKELQEFQNSTFDEFTRQRFIEDQKTIMELSGRLQELQNEVNCMNDSKDFRMLSRCAVEIHTLPVNQEYSLNILPFEGLLRPSFISQRHSDGPPNIWGTSGISGNVFANPQGSSSVPYPPEFSTPATFACWKIRFKTEVCFCSQFPTEAMLWIKEVEFLVDSVDELRSSSSTRGVSMPNFEVFDARIASAQNKIIHNFQFKRRISLEEQKAQKEDRYLRGRQIAYLIYDQFQVTGTHDSVENYTDLFTIVRNDDIQEFDSWWDGILLSMTKIPPDEILEGWYKLRIRESEKLKTVLELYDLETHQKKLGLDYHRLKTMVKRSIEQEIRNNNFGAGSGNFDEKNAVVKNQGIKQRVQRILGDCWQWETNGQCVKGDNFSFRHDMNKCGKSSPPNPSPNSFMRQNERKPSMTRSPRGKRPSGRMSRWPCKDYFRGTCSNSFCERWHPPDCLYYKTQSGCRFGEKCSFAHRQVDEQPTKRSKSHND